MNQRLLSSPRRHGFTLIEVLVGLAILSAGILAIAAIFPYTFRAQRDAEILTLAAALAQMKAEEIRRDDSKDGKLVLAIRQMTLKTPKTPIDPIVFANEPRLAYSFCGQSILYAGADASDPRGASGVARVIISYASTFRATQDVVYELRFSN